MAAAKSNSDAMAYYLSDPAGLGGARSAREFCPLEPVIDVAIPPLIVERVSPDCGEGTGVITAYSGDQVTFTAPGDDEGAAVTLAANTAALVESADPAKSVRVYRDAIYSDADLEGVMSVGLVAGMNNAVGMRNITTAGATTYGGVWLVNQSTQPITGIAVTPGSGYTVVFETPVGGVVQEIADDTTAPSAVSFAGSASLSSLGPAEAVFLWWKRVVGATTVNAEASGSVSIAWDWGGVTYTDVLSGKYRIADSSLAVYELYIGEDTAPDFTASPAASSATLPFSHALTEEVTSNWAVRKRNTYGLRSFNTLTAAVVVGVGGADETPVLTDPTVVSLVSGPGGIARLWVRYNGANDATAADYFRLYITDDGSTPDPVTDTPADTAMRQNALARPELEQIIEIGPYAYGDVVKVIVRAYSSELEAESASETVHSLTIDTQNPVGAHRLGLTMGGYRGLTPSAQEGTVYYNDPTNTVGIRTATGEVVLFAPASEVLRAERGRLSWFRTPLWMKNTAHSAAGSASPVEVVSATEIYINVSGTRRCKIDLVNFRIEAATFVQQAAALSVPVIGPVHTTADATYIQVRDSVTGRWTPAIKVDSSGVVTIPSAIQQEVP